MILFWKIDILRQSQKKGKRLRMSIKAVLFDLDGTLLKMDQEEFAKIYFKYLAKHLAKRGYETDKLLKVFLV